MSDDTAAADGPSAGGSLVRAGARLAADLLVVTLWVLFLTLLFLETAWLRSRWLFYALLVLGVGTYVSLTAAWTRRGRGR